MSLRYPKTTKKTEFGAGVCRNDDDGGGRNADAPPAAGFWKPLGIGGRLLAAGLALCIGVAFFFVHELTPDERGWGTHEQLGLRPCWFVDRLGWPCPFCGMTTALSQMAHGRPLQALLTQPAGAIGAASAWMTAAACLGFAFAGRWPARFAHRIRGSRIVWMVAALIVAAWLFKGIMHTLVR